MNVGQKPFSLKFNLISNGKHSQKFGLNFGVGFFSPAVNDIDKVRGIERDREVERKHQDHIPNECISSKSFPGEFLYLILENAHIFVRLSVRYIWVSRVVVRHCCYNIHLGIQ